MIIITDSTELISIDCELIAELKRSGRYQEASDMLKAYHDCMRDSWSDTRKKMAKIRGMVANHKNKVKGVCIQCKNIKAVKGKILCNKCKLKKRKYNLIYIEKRRKLKVNNDKER